MPRVTVRFYEELNDFLPTERRKRLFSVDVPPGSTTKSVIENLGVPHTEIDLVLVNGESADLGLRLNEGDRMSVYPVFESWDIGPISRVRAVPLRVTRFSADVHLGKLARFLRMMGFDTSYRNDRTDDLIVSAARAERRIVLSRDRGLLKRRVVTHGYLVRSLAPREQLAEVLARFDLAGQVRLFGRCMSCNAVLTRVNRISVLDQLPPAVAEMCTEFSRCPGCGKVFWKGTHWETMKKLAAEVLGRQQPAQRFG
ncbi:MAG: Mut7-C RNAse domain-containing protein [Spirochaetia bacterium]